MNKNFGILILFIAGALFGRMVMVEAASRGIGISPARIELEGVSSWPHTVPLLVTNLSQEPEWFEITLPQNHQDMVSIHPSRFPLDPQRTVHVVVTFGEPKEGISGVIRIAATRTLPEGFETGTGIEVPFHISDTFLKKSAPFSGAVHGIASGFWHEKVWGGLVILMSILFLWFLAQYATKKLFQSHP
ncbi:MAG: hypothetical protein AAB567_03130 [Patescibacteria group bacterium]